MKNFETTKKNALKFINTYHESFWTSEESQLLYDRYLDFPGDWDNIRLKYGYVKSLNKDKDKIRIIKVEIRNKKN